MGCEAPRVLSGEPAPPAPRGGVRHRPAGEPVLDPPRLAVAAAAAVAAVAAVGEEGLRDLGLPWGEGEVSPRCAEPSGVWRHAWGLEGVGARGESTIGLMAPDASPPILGMLPRIAPAAGLAVRAAAPATVACSGMSVQPARRLGSHDRQTSSAVRAMASCRRGMGERARQEGPAALQGERLCMCVYVCVCCVCVCVCVCYSVGQCGPRRGTAVCQTGLLSATYAH